MKSETDATKRFSDRVAEYVKYRPGYPSALLAFLAGECGLEPSTVVADIGSGTGKLTELFLDNGNIVHAVEPNREMRRAAEALLSGRPGFRSVDGRAEATTLGASSVGLAAAGQAFHWFDREKAAVEFRRILSPGGYAVLVWNDREADGSPFLGDYEAFLDVYSIDYREVSRRNTVPAESLQGFFGGAYGEKSFPHSQTLDYDGLLGRYLSCSYAFTREHPLFKEAAEKLRGIYAAHARGGVLEFAYQTKVYFGELDRSADQG